MGTVTSSAFVSLDGVVNHMEKWHFDYVDEESDALALAQLTTATAMVMGRNTYEVYASTWPGRSGEYADLINAMPKHVASTTLTQPAWNNTTVLTGDLVDSVRALRDQDRSALLLHGYGPVAAALLEADVLTDLHLWVHPHLAGVGDPEDLLLRPGVNKKLQLTDVRRFASGVVVLSLTNPNA